MPVYEYECAKCGQTTEALRAMRQADDPIACQHCGSKKTRRAHSVFAAATKDSTPAPAPGGCCGCPNEGACGMG